jgi:NAD-dependent dihydropyrimidine dehydrogenase PreA subunit
MINIQTKEYCCGCGACVEICPRHCISFHNDKEGFKYPRVNIVECIDCHLCEKVCPVTNQADPQKPLSVYAAKNTNEEELLRSSSGGIFILLAKLVLHHGGVVFGAKFDKNWDVIHAYAETEEEAQAFMGSKYVQSHIGNTYSQAKNFLKQGRKVLFSGTPCQIAGLKRFLGKDYDNLLTVDVICHGVPSPKVWQRYLDEIKGNAFKREKTFNYPHATGTPTDVQIESIFFRDKRTGWKKYSFTLSLVETLVDGKKNTTSLSHKYHEDPYMKLFLRDLILRPSCYQCPAKGGKSQSDLTIADFWRVENFYPDLVDEYGVGLMVIKSGKGLQATSSLQLELQKVSFEDAIAGNPMYMNSVSEPQNRKKCFRLLNYTNKSLDMVLEILYRQPLITRIKQKINKLLRQIIKHHLI